MARAAKYRMAQSKMAPKVDTQPKEPSVGSVRVIKMQPRSCKLIKAVGGKVASSK